MFFKCIVLMLIFYVTLIINEDLNFIRIYQFGTLFVTSTLSNSEVCVFMLRAKY
jgi:hypothetical protein